MPARPVIAQQPGDPLAADTDLPAQPQLGVHSRRAVAASGLGVDVHDLVGQVRVVDVAVGRWPVTPLVVARSGHLQHPAGHRDVDAVAGELTDQPEHYFGSTFSRAK